MNPRLIRTGISELLPMVRTGDPTSHVSAVIRSLCVKLGHFDDDGGVITAADQTRFEMGSAFEDAVAHGLARRYNRDNPDKYILPGEFEEDGLLGTPDLLDSTPLTVIEIKFSKLSTRHDAESVKFWKYWVQIKAYCRMCGTSTGQLHICHVNGDYRANRDYVYNVWEDVFSRAELDENWRMLLTERSEMQRQRNR